MKRTILAALLATGALVSVQASAVAPNYNDENDTSWLPKVSQEASISKRSNAVATDAVAQKPTIRFNDENDASWLPTPAKR